MAGVWRLFGGVVSWYCNVAMRSFLPVNTIGISHARTET
jgi:hypothetical protein